MPSNRFAVMTALGAIGAIAGSVSVTASASCTEGMDTIAWTVKIKNEESARAALCGTDDKVSCGQDSIIANYDASTKLSFDDDGNWQVKSGAEVVLNKDGYKGEYALSAAVDHVKLLDLEKLNEGLDSPVDGVANCYSTFAAALDEWLALQTPCDEVGNAKQDDPGACATGTDACVDGFERQGNVCKKEDYVEISGTEAERRVGKRSWFNVMRKAGMKQRTAEADADFKKRKFKGMKINTRAHFKEKMQQRVGANPENKKKHVMRKEERMPVSIANDSNDFKHAFKTTLRSKFSADRDVGIIVGPEKHKDTIKCKAGMTGDAAYDDILDDDDCITYDAAIDGDTSDVHVLGSDTSYNVGGIAIRDKYVPVVKQTLANADAETYDMSCWGGDAWENQHKVEMGADIYVKYTGQNDGNFYNFYTDSSCTGQIVKQSDGKYHLKPQSYTFHRCAGDFGHAFDADGDGFGIIDGQTELLEVTSGDDSVWRCAAHPDNMNGIFVGAGWEAGDEMSCTVKRSGVVVKVDTIVGSSVTAEVDDDKCDVGFGCLTDDTADPLVCLTGDSFGCEECQIPEANGEVVAAPCIAQKCVAGEGAFVPNSSPAGAIDLAAFDYGDGAMGRGGIAFDVNQDPSDCGKVGEDKCSGDDNPQGNPNCVSCPPGYYSPDDNGYCYPHTTCGDHLQGTSRLTGASETAAGSCAPCADDTYAALPTDNCVANTQCGDQLNGMSRLIDADRTTAGSCALCDADTYAALPTDNCVANTQCGDQLNDISRLIDADRTTAGSCAPCADDTYAADGQTDCVANTQCGKGADGESRLIGANRTTAGTCAPCAATTFAEHGADDCACKKGDGCESDDTGSCAEPLVCESCEIPEANNAVDKSVCAAQVCNPGFGYDESKGFDSTLDPTDPANLNCHACDNGKFSVGGTGQCVDYSTDESCPDGYNRDLTHNSKHSDRQCIDITPPTFHDIDIEDIDENSAAGQVVLTGVASDTSNSVVTVTLEEFDADSFYIEPDTDGNPDAFVVKMNKSPDYEQKNNYHFVLKAKDVNDLSFSSTIQVKILNLDEVAPRFTSGPASDILESAAPGTAVYTATTLDDYDISGGVTYSLSGLDALKIDQSGQVTLKNTISDGEYSFTVTATDAADNAAQKIVSLTVRPDEDQDGIDDEDDECFILHCTAQQLTDAYAMLKENNECSNSRRVHTHANEIRTCVTTGCNVDDHISQIKSAIETKQSVC